MSNDFCRYLDSVEQIAVEAGHRILEIYERDHHVRAKPDGSPVTDADQAAQAVIVDRLARMTPEIPVLAEESPDVDYERRAGWERFWLVDPLDGTKEFINRNGEFTVNIALIENQSPVLGVVHVPVKRMTYLACRDGGAYRRDQGTTRIAIAASVYGGKCPRVVASRSHADSNLDAYLTRVGEHALVSMGSSLKFCLVAEGAADVYPRLGPTMEWDTAAAQCVVEAAGGRIVDIHNRPLRYNKPSLRNPWVITSGAGDYDWTRFLPPQNSAA